MSLRPAFDVPARESHIRHVVGVMTGTSIDGMDMALVRIEGRGLSMQASLVRHLARPLGAIGPRLRAAAEQVPMTAGDFASLALDFGSLHADVIAELLNAAGGQSPDLICIHGQTVFHAPPVSWQLVNPAPIAAQFHCPVVSDLRQADLAAGGQGAPISPLADWVLFRDAGRRRAVVNLGGFCNVTVLPSGERIEDIRGFDVCACNQILDAVARIALGKPFDADGAAANSGSPNEASIDELVAILNRQRTQGRSLGTGDEAIDWVKQQTARLSPVDLAASAVQAIARCVATCLKDQHIAEAILAGGGVHNAAVLNALRSQFPGAMLTSDQLGVPIDAREAMCFAVLGALCADGVAITLPQVTGCTNPAPLSGSWIGIQPGTFTAEHAELAEKKHATPAQRPPRAPR